MQQEMTGRGNMTMVGNGNGHGNMVGNGNADRGGP